MSSDQHFDAFGVKSLWYVQSPKVFGFGGKHQYHTDRNNGLLLLGHRYYDRSIGRFIAQHEVMRVVFTAGH